MKKIILVLLLFCNIAHAEVITDKSETRIFFGDRVEYFEDKKHLELPELLKQKPGWQTSTLQSFSFGLTKSAYWLRFDLENKTDREILLTFNTINNDLINLYIVNKDGSYTEKIGGCLYPFNHREVYDKDIFFIIPKYNGTKTIYARFISNYVMNFVPEIVPGAKAAYRTIKAYLPYVIFYSIMLALLLDNFFIFISSKDKSYLILVFIILIFSLHDAALDGLGYMFLWPCSAFFENMVISFSISLMGIPIGYFLQLLLETKRKYRIVHRILNSYIISSAAIFILSFFLEKYITTTIITLFVIPATLITICPMFYMGVIKRNRTGLLLFIVFLIFDIVDYLAIATSSPSIIKSIPFLNDYFLILYIIKFTKIWFIITTSFILADKINIMRNELEISYDKVEKSSYAYRSIFNGTQEAICLVDIKDYKITDANESMLKMFDMSYSEVIGKSIIEFNVLEGQAVKDKGIKILEKIKAGQDQQFEWQYKRKNGEKFWAEVTISHVIINDEQKFMLVIRDISYRKQAQEEREKMLLQLTQAQKMEAIGSLSGGLAHDFNNILTGILGSSSLLERQLEKNDINKAIIKKYISIISEASHKAAAIVRNLLTLTRKHELKLTSTDLNIILKNVTDICKNSFPKSVIIQIKYLDTSAIVKADISGLDQVFLNILVNASHAMTIMRSPSEAEGGIISIKIDKQYADDAFCRLYTEAVKGIYYFSVSIQDNGCGMDSSIINKIFDPFFTTKSESGGSGLGLSMVYNIIKQHNGIIRVYSEKGVGSTFIVYLPEYVSDKTIEHDGNKTITKGRGKILVIDDEKFVRTIAKDMLEESGYEVMAASGGIEGIEIFRNNAGSIDAVLLDTSMPGLSGFDTFKAIKEINRSAVIIMSSGFSMDERAQKAFDSGAVFFIQKPYTNIQLSRAMHDALNAVKR